MLGNNIRSIRKSRKMSINILSKLSNVSLGYLSDLENNKSSNPTKETLEKLAKALNVTVDEFFKTSDLEKKNQHEKGLGMVPKEFTNPKEAREYVDKHQIFGSEGFDPDKLDDNEILEFANALLEQMKMVSYKYKK